MASLRVLAFDPEGRPVAFDTWHNNLQLYLLSDLKDRQHRPCTTLSLLATPFATTAIGRLLLPYLFPELSAFTTVADLVTHLRTSDAHYRATVPAEFLPTNQPPMFITLFFIVTRLLDSLRSVRDHFLTLDPTSLTVDLLDQHLLAAETSAVAVGAARGTPRSPFFEGCSPSPLSPSFTSAAVADVSVPEDVGAALSSAKRRNSKGNGGRGSGGGSGGGGGGSGSGSGGSGRGGGGSGGGGTGGGRSGPRRGGPGGGRGHAEGDCYRCVPPDPGIAAAALGASASGTPPGTSPAEALHTFTLDSGASRCFFRDSTTLTPLPAPVPFRLADPSGGPVVARSSTVLPCPAVPSGSLSGLHLPSFSTNLGRVCTRWLPSLLRLFFDTIAWVTPPYHTFVACTPVSLSLVSPGLCLPYRPRLPRPVFLASRGGSAPLLTPPHFPRRLLLCRPSTWTCRAQPVKGEVADVLIPRIRTVCLKLRERFDPDLPVLHLHSDRGGEFSSDLLRDICLGEGITQSFTLPDSPQQNGIAERRIGLVMEVARTSMIHAAAPHFLWLFAVRYAAHQLNLWPRVSLPETSPTLRWTGKVGDASVFRVWGSRAFVRDKSADKLSARAIPCSEGLGFESQCVHSGHPSAGGCQRSTGDPRLILGKGYRLVVLGGYGRTNLLSLGVLLGQEVLLVLRRDYAHSSCVSALYCCYYWSWCTGGTAASGPGSARTSGARAAGTGGVGCAGAGDPTEPGVAGAGGVGARVVGVGGPGAGGAGAAGAGVGGTGAGGAGAAGAGAVDPGAGGAGDTPPLQPASPVPAPSPYTEQSEGLTEHREHASCLVSPVCTDRCTPRSRPPPVPGTHTMALRPFSFPLRVPLPAPPESSLPQVPDPASDRAHTASPTVARLLASAITDPFFVSAAAFSLVAELLDIAAACRLDYATALVAESEFASPASVRGECALGTHVLEDRQEDFECLAAAVPRFASLLLAPEGDPDAPDLLTPRSYAEAITGPYSSQWHANMDAEMASWKSTGTYVDAVPPSMANIVDGMWIFRVKRPLGSPPAFKARYVARGFSQRQGVDYSQTFSPTPKMTILHEEIWLRRPPGFTGTFSTGTQWSLRRPVYGLRQAPREWHDTLRTTLAALGFAPSTADSSLFLRTDTSLPPFYVLVYVDDLVFATADTEALTLVKSELHKRHTSTDLGELRSYLGLQITRERAWLTITLTQSQMVNPVLQRFGFQYSSPQLTPLSTSHSLSAPPSDESIELSGPYPEPVGCLMYLMTCTRPDLTYPLNLLARYVAPGRHRKVHWDAAMRVLHFLCSTSCMGLVLGGQGPVVLTGHADASSSCEAKIYAGAMAAQELCWLTYLLTDLGEQPRLPPVLYVDNKAMIALCQEHILEHITKHIALQYFLARVLQQRGQIRLAYVATRANTADVFTNALPPGDHQRFATVLGLVPTLPHLLTA
ncbi:unnamed protein product [Closterium sp. NIES-53]